MPPRKIKTAETAAPGVSAETLLRWWEHPVSFVEDLFEITPDEWQKDALEAFPHSPRLAMRACTGPGKTAVLAWLGLNFMLTRPHVHAGATSINAANLKSNLWRELEMWRAKSPLLSQTFDMTKTEIFSRTHPGTWRLEARTWAKDANQEQIGQALAGLHGSYVLWLMDETGGYPDSILPVVEAIFSGNPTEAHIVQAGNPTNLAGPLYHACRVARKFWRVIEVTGDPDNPKRSPRISLEHARQQIEQYGRDSPFVRVRIFGEFPQSSINALIGAEEVADAMGREYNEGEYGRSAKIIGTDVARFGLDSSVIFKRQGLMAFNPIQLRNINGPTGAGILARHWIEWDADAVFIDNGGGFGSTWIDSLQMLGHAPIGVVGSAEPNDRKYYNKRAEMYDLLAQWIRKGGALPRLPQLAQELAATTYTHKNDRLLVEDKEGIKAKLTYSPDHADALALTFAQPVSPKKARIPGMKIEHVSDYNPMADLWKVPSAR